MRRLRKLRTIAGIVLAWYVLFLGVSVSATAAGMASPFTMVCSADGGTRWVQTGQDDGQAAPHAGMDCPLCASALAPPTLAARPGIPALPQLPDRPAQLAGPPAVPAAAPPLPSRGPPGRTVRT